jgi:hypothetical protein
MGKNKLKRGRRGSRRHPINDVPQNDTNIRVRFKKAITFNYASNQEKIKLDPGISTLTKDLAVVYKLYRCTHLKITFQASTYLPGAGSNPRYAVNYVPALEFTGSSPLSIEDYEGPAVGFWQGNRGHPYTWTVPSNVLNAMPYNWYETKSNTPDTSDLVQGTILSTCDLESDDQTALLELVFEFQTLEDPDFLAAMAHDSRVRMIRPQMTARHQLDDYEEISEEEVRRSDSIESRSAFRDRRRV